MNRASFPKINSGRIDGVACFLFGDSLAKIGAANTRQAGHTGTPGCGNVK
jgi:hypothetical protein